MTQRQIGPFILEQQIGVGGMGVVYQATYPKNGRKVAVKILSPGLMSDDKLLSRFEREITILKRLNHPNIVKYYGGGIENNQRYYAMQLIDGGSLQDVLKKRGKLTWEQAIHVGRQVCSALEHAHNAGIIHRDLKPANLFLSKKGRLMLGDFGIARDTEATALTAAGKTVGTYAYMAPEQINGAHVIGGRTDLYALGCLLYETLVGVTPFVGDNPADMLMQHMQDDPHNVSEYAPDCPVWLDNLIDRMLAKDPADRPYDALAVHTELGEIRERIAEGNSVAGSSTNIAGQISTKGDDHKLKQSLLSTKRKKKKRRNAPFYERTWFLAACLTGLVGLTVWLTLPDSVETLYREARDVRATGDYTARRDALDDFIIPALEREPEGEHADELTMWAEEIRLEVLERQMDNKTRRNLGKLDSDFEKVYVAARKMEEDLDANPLAAIERYDQIVQIQSASNATHPEDLTEEEVRVWRALFTRRLNTARERLLDEDDARVRHIFQSRMETAELLLSEGDRAAAMNIWETTARQFADVEVVKDFQSYAKMRRRGQRADVPWAE